ncbi:MAG: hypothetical protein WAO52_13395 [Prolixibacteraceae bacterium]
MKKGLLLLVCVLFVFQIAFSQRYEKPIILSRNFNNASDLWESIGRGIVNYEADVMYIYGKNFVTHLMPDSATHKLPTLTDAYLYPLFKQFKKNNGEIIPGYSGDIFLVLNFSAQPIQIYKQLATEMRPFADMLTFTLNGEKHQGKMQILIKDKASLETINNIKPSFLGLVGNLADIEKNIDSEIMPLIEIELNEISNWKGTGNIPFEDYSKIKTLVEKVHAQNKKISITKCPAYKSVAELIKSSKADFVNTTEEIRMAEFWDSIK